MPTRTPSPDADATTAAFHPVVRRWFLERFDGPTPPQRAGWPTISRGDHTLIAAPTGSGKTLTAFLDAISRLVAQGASLADETQVVYVSPLKALSNDVQKNLQQPLEELRELDPSLPEIRVLVRTGDTKQSSRTAMRRKPPHVLVTTPESLYILLTSASGQEMLKTTRTVIVDEIHALVGDKRGAHLALTLERLADLAGEFQRIGLSATQRPIERTANFLTGTGRECTIVDTGHLRELDLALEVPASPLTAVCSHETWSEIYEQCVGLIQEHTTTLVFANTRKLTERIAAKLCEVLGEDKVASHHGSLSRERRLDAEQRLKNGELQALVATASLELGIDIGDVDLVIQVGVPARIATFLQRAGRAGHGQGLVPKSRIFPLTRDELVAASAILLAVDRGELDETIVPPGPCDILAQQLVAACVQDDRDRDELFNLARRAWPYRKLTRKEFDGAIALHTQGRYALLHENGVGQRVLATKRARIPAVTSGGAIPDRADYEVVQEPEGIRVGTLDEDFAIESNAGDIFQLGTTSWRILKVEPGKVRVADAKGLPPTLPFWFGEAPSRSRELAAATSEVRSNATSEQWSRDTIGLSAAAATQLAEYLASGEKTLGAIPTTRRIVAERFFDESGGTQLILHAPFGSRINRALGLALRKRFCRGFGFELQAAANEEAIVLSLGPMHSFALEDVFEFLHPNTARDVLVQALLPAPMFETRWRWNVSRALVVPRFQSGKRVPPPILRMRADDALAAAFPEARACGETLPPGDLPVPDHPLVTQTVEDCLHEAMDVDGMIEVLRGIRDGSIETLAVDTPTPSEFACEILNAGNFAFLDDAPLEERRTQAVVKRRALDARTADELGALDHAAVERVREEAWPQPENAEEVHEALGWMGFVTVAEATDHAWTEWIDELATSGRVQLEGDRWFATEATRDPRAVLRGRLEALGPVFDDEPLLKELQSEGVAMQVRLDGRDAWCDRRLLARIHRYTVERLRAEIEPVTAAAFLHFLAAWQHVAPGEQAEGMAGLGEVIRQLSGIEVPAYAWETHVLPQRVRGYRREWLDQLTLSGEVAWGRLWGRGQSAVRNTPLALVPREQLAMWRAGADATPPEDLGAAAATILEELERRGATFPTDLEHAIRLLPSQFEEGISELVARGVVTCDSFAAVRQMLVAPSKRKDRQVPFGIGRWAAISASHETELDPEFVFDRLLERYGVVFRRLLLREQQPLPWRELVRVGRMRELRGTVRGGRFVAGFAGEQFATPDAVTKLRQVRRSQEGREPPTVAAADPLNLRGILTPDERVPAQRRAMVTMF